MARFRLERVRRLREQFRRQAEGAVGEVQTKIAANAAVIAAARAAQLDSHQAANARLLAGTTVAEITLWTRYEASLVDQEAEAKRIAQRLQQELQVRRTALTKARLEERKIDRLRELWTARQATAAQRTADRMLDELALRQHAMRR